MSYRPDYTPFTPRLKTQVLAEEPVCRNCCFRPAVVVDHIVPTAEGGQSTRDNAQGLCDPCHQVKTAAEIRRGHARSSARGKFEGEGHPGNFYGGGLGSP